MINVRKLQQSFALFMLLGSVAAIGADEFPREIVDWRPVAENPVFSGTGGDEWDQKIRERGWIMVEDGEYRLWYTGYNDDRSPTKFLGHARSTDGIHWTRDPENPIFDEGWVEDMCVVLVDGTYYLFAEGRNDIAHLLTSPDGLKWTAQGPLDIRLKNGEPISPGPRGTPTVWVEDGTWYLFYERGDQGIWLATSRDREVWTNIQDDPVIGLGPEPYDRTAVALNQIIKRDGVYYGIYHANQHRPWRDWTTCLARSTDLIHWDKYSANPIIENNQSSGIFVDGPDGKTYLYTMHPDVRRHVNPVPKNSKSNN